MKLHRIAFAALIPVLLGGCSTVLTVDVSRPSPAVIADLNAAGETRAATLTFRDGTRERGRQVRAFPDSVQWMNAVNHRQALPLHELQAIRLGPNHRAAARGLGIGAACGAAVGATVGLLMGSDPPGIVAFTAGQKALALAIPFAVLGGVAGAITEGVPRHSYRFIDSSPHGAATSSKLAVPIE